MHTSQVIHLMITDDEKLHYLAVKKISVLFKGKTSRNNQDFIYLNCLYSFRTKNKLKRMKMSAKIMTIVL